MEPKRKSSSYNSTAARSTKRARLSDAPLSRSPSPEEAEDGFPFRVWYPTRKPDFKLQESVQQLLKYQEQHVSRFVVTRPGRARSLDTSFTITPTQDWCKLKIHGKLEVRGQEYSIGHFVYVARSTSLHSEGTGEAVPNDIWIGQILQVRGNRGSTADNVYVLVVWLYWPDEIPAPRANHGRKPHHGSNELIVSNHLQVLSASMLAGKADVEYWSEDTQTPPLTRYWRQTFNYITSKLSTIRSHCLCRGHYNPENSMYICDNRDCGIWFHEACLIDDILTKTVREKVAANHETQKSPKVLKSYDGKFEGTILDDGKSTPQWRIVDLRPGSNADVYGADVLCPKCATKFGTNDICVSDDGNEVLESSPHI